MLPYDVISSRKGKRCVIHRIEKILDPPVANSVGCRLCTLTNRDTAKSNYHKIYYIVAKVFNGLEPEVVTRKDNDISNDCASNLIHVFSSLNTSDREWRAIPGYETLYEISNLGEIRSLGRLASHKSGFHSIRKSARLLKYAIDEDGYFGVELSDIEGKAKQYRVNRLVATAFIPNPDRLPVVNHKDGNKQNNRVENLEWCTVKYNTFEAYRMGLNPASTPHPVICLTTNTRFESVQSAANWIGCDHGNITQSIKLHSCCKGGYCFVYENNYPEDDISYLKQAEETYVIRSKPTYHSKVKCLDTGQVSIQKLCKVFNSMYIFNIIHNSANLIYS